MDIEIALKLGADNIHTITLKKFKCSFWIFLHVQKINQKVVVVVVVAAAAAS